MNTEKIINDLRNLPPEGRELLVNFIEFLNLKYSKNKSNKKKGKSSLKTSKFIGIWQDRVDMKESERFVRKLREKEWKN